jgi:hypothetical protein
MEVPYEGRMMIILILIIYIHIHIYNISIYMLIDNNVFNMVINNSMCHI